MSQRPTPETDAQARAIYANVSPTNNQRFVAMTKWAEELEQQRDESRAKLVGNEAYQCGLLAEMEAMRKACKAAVSLTSEMEAMREAIEEAAEAFFTWNDVGLCKAWLDAKDKALAKLQPLINA